MLTPDSFYHPGADSVGNLPLHDMEEKCEADRNLLGFFKQDDDPESLSLCEKCFEEKIVLGSKKCKPLEVVVFYPMS